MNVFYRDPYFEQKLTWHDPVADARRSREQASRARQIKNARRGALVGLAGAIIASGLTVLKPAQESTLADAGRPERGGFVMYQNTLGSCAIRGAQVDHDGTVALTLATPADAAYRDYVSRSNGATPDRDVLFTSKNGSTQVAAEQQTYGNNHSAEPGTLTYTATLSSTELPTAGEWKVSISDIDHASGYGPQGIEPDRLIDCPTITVAMPTGSK